MFARAAIGGSLALLASGLSAGAAGAEPPYLLTLEGPAVLVRYAPGALDRADHVRRRFSLLARDFGPRKAGGPVLAIDLLDAEGWLQAGLPEPFGLPAVTAAGALVLPAWGDAGSVRVWRQLLDGWLPTVPGTPLRGTPEETASLAAADLVGEVEAGRLLLARRRVSADRPWAGDLLACALAVSAIRRYEEARWPEVRALFDRLAAAPADLLPARLSAVRWCSAAGRIGEEAGGLPAKPLLKMARRNSGRLRSSALLERFPWLSAWGRLPSGG